MRVFLTLVTRLYGDSELGRREIGKEPSASNLCLLPCLLSIVTFLCVLQCPIPCYAWLCHASLSFAGPGSHISPRIFLYIFSGKFRLNNILNFKKF